MPLFEYACSCGHRFETLVPTAAKAARARPCPACGSGQAERQHSTFAAMSGGGATATTAAGASPCGSCGSPEGPGSCSR